MDMAACLMAEGFEFPAAHRPGQIRSITNVRDTAIIITDLGVWRALPCYPLGFRVELLMML